MFLFFLSILRIKREKFINFLDKILRVLTPISILFRRRRKRLKQKRKQDEQSERERKREEEEGGLSASLHFVDLEVVADVPRRFRERSARWKARIARGDSLAQDDELWSDSNGKLVGVAPCVRAASPPSLVVLLVDDSRLRRYNCGLRSETRGNPRERRLLRSFVRINPCARACIRVGVT